MRKYITAAYRMRSSAHHVSPEPEAPAAIAPVNMTHATANPHAPKRTLTPRQIVTASGRDDAKGICGLTIELSAPRAEL